MDEDINWKLNILRTYLPEDTINKINNTSVPINNIEDKFIENLPLQISFLLNQLNGQIILVLILALRQNS